MRPRVVVAGPPAAAVGGVASHTKLMEQGIRGCTAFDQRWPFVDRPGGPAGRVAMHAFSLLRWAGTLALLRPRVAHVQVTDTGALRDVVFVEMAAACRVHVVSHVHATDFFGEGSDRRDRALTRITRRSDAVVVMSKDQRRRLARLRDDPERIVYIANPAPDLAETDEMTGSSEPAIPAHTSQRGPVRLLVVGEICTRKGQAELVRSAARLRRQRLELEVELVGPWGELSEADRRLIEDDAHTTVSGVLRGSDMTMAYDRADVFVLFSRSEGQPLAILEAMSRGLPVVATDTGGVADMIEGADGNRLVPVGATGALDDALREFARSPATRTTVGAGNREHVRAHHGVRDHLLNLVGVYRMVSGTT